MRKSYGSSWWGTQWLNALTEIDHNNRLPRGKTLANKGAVWEINIHQNSVFAKVKGNKLLPFKVELRLPVFTDKVKARILEIIEANPVYLSKLLNRELPIELYEDLIGEGIEIFPHAWEELLGGCTCLDEIEPCKHAAAVIYLIANEIDKNPFLVFELKGFDLFRELEKIGFASAEQKDVPIVSIENLLKPYDPEEEPFEWDYEQFNTLDFSTLPNCLDQILTLLSEKPVFFPTASFKGILEKVYKNVAKRLKKEIREDKELIILPAMDATEEVELFLDEEGDFLTCKLRNEKGKSVLTFANREGFITWLQQIPINRVEMLAPVLRGLVLAYHLAEKLVVNSACIPELVRIGERHYKIRWLPANLNKEVKALCDKVNALITPGILFYKINRNILQPAEGDYYNALLSLFISHLIQSRQDLDYRYQIYDVIQLFFYGSLETFEEFEMQQYPTAIQLWLRRLYFTDKDFVPVLKVEERANEFFLTIMVDDKSNPNNVLIPLNDIFNKEEYNKVRLELLRDLAVIMDHFPEIERVVNSRGKEILRFNSEAFVPILLNVLPTIQLFGIKVILPSALQHIIRPKVSMFLEGEMDSFMDSTSVVSLQDMMSFKWQVAIGDKLVSPEEFKKQVQRLSGIVKLHDKYVYVSQKEMESLIDKLDTPPEVDTHQLLQVALTEEYEGAGVKLDKKARKLIDQLMEGDETEVPEGLRATLRPYQLRGYKWLYKNARLGFGSLIADDMGLGKTLQVITTLLKLKEDNAFKKQKGLIIVPTTLLTNWEKEIQKFAPDLKTYIYHGPNRDLKQLKEADALITTYGVLRTESAKLQKQKWLLVVIDEAQNIKNPTTSQTRAVKKIKAPVKIAMSGTPVENRLSEYWSIFDFSNKGYLGSLKKFKENFARPIEVDRDQAQLNRFRKITEPFILRRLKTDKSIIQDLPDKIEKDQYCQLTSEQAALYQNVLDSTLEAIGNAEGINRRGLVLKLITALKQVCNHPGHYLKKGRHEPNRSGKSELLLTLMGQTLENNEKSLIFTQYKEMGNIIVEMLEKEFNMDPPPFLHGGVSRKNRDEMVEDFQNNRTTRIMLLSLKAGGTGLNLTAASNVIHYDLWWNPAVESQATDRAYRIGQTRNVMVHRFITKGTFEEKINKLLQHKKELANITVGTGEKWIGDLSNDELQALVSLER